VLKRGKNRTFHRQEVLEELAQQHALPAKVLEHRQLTKLKNTYLDALPAVLGKDGRLHTTFDQGRRGHRPPLPASTRNLQNIPIRTPIGAKIREESSSPEPGFGVLLSATLGRSSCACWRTSRAIRCCAPASNRARTCTRAPPARPSVCRLRR